MHFKSFSVTTVPSLTSLKLHSSIANFASPIEEKPFYVLIFVIIY